jgi:hypothetical protein
MPNKPYNGSLSKVRDAICIYDLNDAEQRALRRDLGRNGVLTEDGDGDEAAPLTHMHLALARVLENKGLHR